MHKKLFIAKTLLRIARLHEIKRIITLKMYLYFYIPSLHKNTNKDALYIVYSGNTIAIFFKFDQLIDILCNPQKTTCCIVDVPVPTNVDSTSF